MFDHVMTSVTYEYSGAVPYTTYNYGDYDANAADIQQYLDGGRGPYAQYQPVSILNYALGGDIPNVEIFLNPNGLGTPGGPYWGPRAFTAYLMMLNPKARGLITLDASGNVNYPNIYLPDTPDGNADTTFMAQAVFNMIQLLAKDPGLEDCVRTRQLEPSQPESEFARRHSHVCHRPVAGGRRLFQSADHQSFWRHGCAQRRLGRSRSGDIDRARNGERRGGRCVADTDDRARPSGGDDHVRGGPRRGYSGGAVESVSGGRSSSSKSLRKLSPRPQSS